jgi:hypothetical protein
VTKPGELTRLPEPSTASQLGALFSAALLLRLGTLVLARRLRLALEMPRPLLEIKLGVHQ